MPSGKDQLSAVLVHQLNLLIDGLFMILMLSQRGKHFSAGKRPFLHFCSIQFLIFVLRVILVGC